MDDKKGYSTTVERYYIDTRPLVPADSANIKTCKPNLPLLNTLPPDVQDSINRFCRAEDKLMSLASALLKFTYIHRTAKLPWSAIQILRTPRPHGRPYWNPPRAWKGDGFKGIEFNVSHQAGIVILGGCRVPQKPEVSLHLTHSDMKVDPDPSHQQIRIGVDVSCTKEGKRSPDLSTQRQLDEWVDTFSEMFSMRERREMKERPVHNPGQDIHRSYRSTSGLNMEGKARRFYTYWALKEAYIKMVGEGLLAEWLRQLEFVNVLSPDPGERLSGDEIMMQVLLKGKDISDSVTVELKGFEDNFLFAMISRGVAEQGKELANWVPLDIEKDIRPCAEGTCSCLNGRAKLTNWNLAVPNRGMAMAETRV